MPFPGNAGKFARQIIEAAQYLVARADSTACPSPGATADFGIKFVCLAACPPNLLV